MPSIKEQTDILVKLQEIDSKIFSLKVQRTQKPAHLKVVIDEFEEKKREAAKTEEGLKAIQIKQKEKELDLKTKEDAIKKFQSQLYLVKTNKEYQSLQKEIEGLKADNSVLEEGVLRVLDEIDAQKERISQVKGDLTRDEAQLQEKKKLVEEEIARIDNELLELNKEREGITPFIEKDLLARYERILKNKDGLAIVPAKDDVCGGCFINLPPQVINEIQMEKGIVICESCARMLYLPQEGTY